MSDLSCYLTFTSKKVIKVIEVHTSGCAVGYLFERYKLLCRFCHKNIMHVLQCSLSKRLTRIDSIGKILRDLHLHLTVLAYLRQVLG